jgi:hypothetical protein
MMRMMGMRMMGMRMMGMRMTRMMGMGMTRMMRRVVRNSRFLFDLIIPIFRLICTYWHF